ncbi:hypothetical protein ABT346_17625 [Micromonospora peucetia]
MTEELQVVTIADVGGRRGMSDPPPAEIHQSSGRPICRPEDV